MTLNSSSGVWIRFHAFCYYSNKFEAIATEQYVQCIVCDNAMMCFTVQVYSLILRSLTSDFQNSGAPILTPAKGIVFIVEIKT